MAFENSVLSFADLIGVFLEKIFSFFAKISASYIFLLMMFMLVGLIYVVLTKFKEVPQWKNIYYFYYY